MGFQLTRFWGLAPDMMLLAAAVATLLVDMAPGKAGRGRAAAWMALCGFACAALLATLPAVRQAPDPFPGMVANDAMAQVAKFLLLMVGMFSAALSLDAAPRLGLSRAEYWALILLATLGMMGLASSKHLMASFITLELFSLAMYVLTGFARRDTLAQEAALKYFVPGAFAGAFFLFGTALLLFIARGASYDTLAMAWHGGLAPRGVALFIGGMGMAMVALAFKAGLAPFHSWVPDVYQGAPTPVSAFLSAAAKVAAIVAMVRLLAPLAGAVPALNAQAAPAQGLTLALALIAALSMTWANLVALRQDNLKRLLAWSSIAHSGYALLGVVAGGAAGAGAALEYTLAYGLMALASFGLVLALEQGGRMQPCLADLDGLGFSRPLYGAALAVAAFSLAGLPPTFGFAAKFSLLKSAVDSGHAWLAVVAVANTVVAAAYYLRITAHLYLKKAPVKPAFPAFGGVPAFVVVMAAALLIYWGLFPGAPMALTGLGALPPLP